jgi:hypothetical protein
MHLHRSRGLAATLARKISGQCGPTPIGFNEGDQNDDNDRNTGNRFTSSQ